MKGENKIRIDSKKDFLIVIQCIVLSFIAITIGLVISSLIIIGILGTLKLIFIGSYINFNIFVICLFINEVKCYKSDPKYFKLKKYHIVLPITCPIAFIIFLLVILASYIIKFLIKLILLTINWSKEPLINR